MQPNDSSVYIQLSDLIVSVQDAETELEIYQHTAAVLSHILPAERASVALLIPDDDSLEIISLSGTEGALHLGLKMPVSKSMVGRSIISNQATIWEPDTSSDYVDSVKLATDGFNCVINAPLIARDAVLGSINIAHTQANFYQPHHLDLLKRVAAIIAIHIDRRRLFDSIRAASDRHRDNVRRLEVLNSIGQGLSTALSDDEVFEIVADCAQQIIKSERVSFARMESDREHFRIAYIRGNEAIPLGTVIPLKNTSVGEAAAKKRTIFIPSLDSGGILGAAGLAQSWSVPVIVADQVTYVLNVATCEVGYSDQDATALFEAIAQNIGLALERIRIQEKAAATLNNLIDDSPLMLVVLNDDGIIQRVSRFGSNALGYKADSLTSLPFLLLHPISERTAAEKRIRLWRQLRPEQVHTEEVQMLVRNGRICWVRQTARVTTRENGQLQILVSCENVDDLHSLNDQLRDQARTDPLTGTPNRLAFNEHLAEAIEIAGKNNGLLAVLFIDLDHFKNINDSLGHDFGDQVLCIAAGKIRRQLRAGDLVSRTGGDEFLVMLSGVATKQAAELMVQRIFSSLQNPITIAGKQVHIGCSIGICFYPDCGQATDVLIKHADIAMYHAKSLGRNNYQFYTPELSTRLLERLKLESDLRTAITNDELRIVFQPQFNVLTNEIIACEALVRWQHPTLGLIKPTQFIPLAEDIGIIDQITNWMLYNALRVLKHLLGKYPKLRISINVSATEFAHRGDLVRRVDASLKKWGLPASVLELELTESTLLEHPEAATEIIEKLNDRGISLAMDDFGTGFASFSNLMRLPLHQVKIDREFVSGIDQDHRKRAIIEGIITMTRKMSLGCIAEGVETYGELSELRALACEAVQGYLLSHPVNENELEALLAVPASRVQKASSQ